MSNMIFTFLEQGSHAAFLYNGQEILKLNKNVTYFGGSYQVRDQVMIPGGKPENAFVMVLSSYKPDRDVLDVRYEVIKQNESLEVRIIPTKIRRGSAMLSRWIEVDTLSVRLEEGRFVWEQTATLRFFEDVDIDAPDTGMFIYRFHHVDGRPSRFFQYIDPAPVGGSGPAVPMLKDWSGYPEPYNGPDSFRQGWKREYVSIIFQNLDNTFSWSELNKTKWANLTNDNRRARPCASKGLLYLVKESGDALEYTIDAPSHYHHVCEWGMDYHCWCDLDPFAKGSIISAGTEIVCATHCQLVNASVTAPIFAKASRIELTPEERAIADRPAYEEPENSFIVSALDRLDAQYWEPTSEGCSWQRHGGYKPESGALVIRNAYSKYGSWEQRSFGTQEWGNPIMVGVRYQLSAWVRVDDFLPDPSETSGPQVGLDLVQYNGPAIGSTQSIIDCGWSLSLIDESQPLMKQIGWTPIKLVTPPCPNNVQRGVLKLRLAGRGTAYFSNARWEPLDD